MKLLNIFLVGATTASWVATQQDLRGREVIYKV